MEKPNWTRNPSGDRPELVFPQRNMREPPTCVPQQVGFLTQEGTPIEVSLSYATELGLVAIGSIVAVSVPISYWVEIQQRKWREQNATRLAKGTKP